MKKVLVVVNAHYKPAKLSQQTEKLATALENAGLSVEIAASDSFFDGRKTDADGVLFLDKDVLLAKRLSETARVFNPPESIAVCDDKAVTSAALSEAGVAVPKSYAVPFTYRNIPYADFGFLQTAEKLVGYPLVIKRANSSLGMGVYLVKERAEAETLLSEIAKDGERALIEEFVAECAGSDIRIAVVGGRFLCAMRRVNEGDFRSNVEQGGTGYPYEPTAEEKVLAERAARALNLDFAGVDILPTAEGPKVIEVNSNAFFGTLEKTTGVDIAAVYADYIKKRLEEEK